LNRSGNGFSTPPIRCEGTPLKDKIAVLYGGLISGYTAIVAALAKERLSELTLELDDDNGFGFLDSEI
jgi:hypothetical protein